jgi:acyl carrier protein
LIANGRHSTTVTISHLIARFLHACGFPTDRTSIKNVREKLSQRPQLDAATFAATYFPEDKRDLAERLILITQRHSRADLTGAEPNDRFVEDFKMDELDSMSLLELVIDIEKYFEITIPDGRAQNIRTFRELVDEIWSLKNPT